MAPPADHNQFSNDASIELFDLSNRDGGDTQIDPVILTDPVQVTDETDTVSPNIHMGSADQRPIREESRGGGQTFSTKEDLDFRVYSVRISRDALNAQQTQGPAVVALNLDELIGDLEGQTATFADFPGGDQPFGQRNDNGSLTFRGDEIGDIHLAVAEGGDEDIELAVVVTSEENFKQLIQDGEFLDSVTESLASADGSDDPADQLRIQRQDDALNARGADDRRQTRRFDDLEETEDNRDLTAERPDLDVRNASGDEDTAIDLDISASLADTDGSEVLFIRIEGVPDGAQLSAGVHLGGGTWRLAPEDLDRLTITPPADSHDDFDLRVTATSRETASGDVATARATLHVEVADVIDRTDVDGGTSRNDRVRGTEGDENLRGLGGNDDLRGGAGSDHVDGGAGSDRVYGDDGDDIVDGGSGNDRVYGGDGDDVAVGGAGNDYVYGDAGSDTVDGGAGNDRVYGGDGDDVLRGGTGADQLDGGKGDDTLIAEDALDSYQGGAGLDTLRAADDGDIALKGFSRSSSIEIVDGGDSASAVRGTEAKNTLDFRNAELRNISEIDAGAGNDKVYGSAAGDTIKGNTGNDYVFGEAGDDSVDGGAGNDRVYGGDGNDVATGGDGNDYVYGDAGDDTVSGGAGSDRLYGGAGNDILDGGSGNDILDGGAGDDTLIVDDVKDSVKGGSGTDTLKAADDGDFTMSGFSQKASIEVIDGGDTESAIRGTDAKNTLDFRSTNLENISEIDAGKGSDTVYGSQNDDVIKGGEGADRLYGEDGNDTIRGEDGNDRLYGGAGNDVLDGGSGNDILDGGAGDDTLIVDNVKDSVKGGSGTDTLKTADDGDFTMSGFSRNASIEVVDGGDSESAIHGTSGRDTLDFRDAELKNISEIDAGANNDVVYGSQGDNVIHGGTGNDKLYGGAGADTLSGGAGRDIMDGGAGDDLFIFGAGSGNDVVHGGDGWLDGIRLQNADGAVPAAGDWEMELSAGSVQEQADNYIALSNDAAGTIKFDDGSELQFDGIERIDW